MYFANSINRLGKRHGYRGLYLADTERAAGFGGHCPILAASIAIGLIFANFVAGNLQSSIDAVGRGQMEAGQMLGFSKLQTMRYIVLP